MGRNSDKRDSEKGKLRRCGSLRNIKQLTDSLRNWFYLFCFCVLFSCPWMPFNTFSHFHMHIRDSVYSRISKL